LVRSFAIVPDRQPARTAGRGAFGPPVGVGVAVGAGHAHVYADALGFAIGVGLHVILGNPGTLAVCLAVAIARGNVAAADPDSPANPGYRPAIQLPCGG
jgi:hypothetical protein